MDQKLKEIPSQDFMVLKRCRFFMKNLGLYAESNFHTFESKINITVPVWIIRFIYSIPMCTCVLLAFWHIIDKDYNLTVSSVAVIIIIGGGHSQVIYFLLFSKNNSLILIIDQLQQLVDKRKFNSLILKIYFVERKPSESLDL